MRHSRTTFLGAALAVTMGAHAAQASAMESTFLRAKPVERDVLDLPGLRIPPIESQSDVELAPTEETAPLATSSCDPYFGFRLTLREDEEPAHPLRAWVSFPSIVHNAHVDKLGRFVEYDLAPRREERPEYYDAYVYPVTPLEGWGAVASGFDLDLEDHSQRRGKMNAVGHGGIDLPQVRGAPIRMVPLEVQMEDARVIFIGRLMGTTIITRHVLREGTGSHVYIVVWGHLDEAHDEMYVGKRLRRNALLGYVGNTDSPDFVHLHYEVRRMREGLDPTAIEPARLITQDTSIPVDPRNVLPLKPAFRRTIAARCMSHWKWHDEDTSLSQIQLQFSEHLGGHLREHFSVKSEFSITSRLRTPRMWLQR